MKKLLFLFTLLLAGMASLSAQNTVSGTVTDRDGNPIPGAKVEIVGSTESVITELDGTFRLETQSHAKKVQVYYAGMQSKVQTIKPGMTVKLSRSNWWNKKPEKYSWLISAQAAFPESGVKNPAFGLMLGRVKTIGWYVKGVYSPSKSTDCDYTAYPEESDMISYWTTGRDKRGFMAATAGVLVRMGCPLYLYAGAGYAERKVAWELADGSYAKHTDYSYSGAAADLGVTLRIGKLAFNGGVLVSFTDDCPVTGNFGIGICF